MFTRNTEKNESKNEEQLKILKNLVMNTWKSQSTKIVLAIHIHNEVFGTGYRCKVESSEQSYTMDFWRHRSSQSTEWQPIKISTEDCWSMVKNEHCKVTHGKKSKESKIFEEKLLCEQNSCKLSSNPSADITGGVQR